MNTLMPYLAVATLWVLSNALADEPEHRERLLQHNPFKSPGLISPPSRIRDSADSSQWTESLRGTLLSDKPLANMDGTLVAVGELYKGYELISVGIGTATFRLEERIVVVTVSEENDDEER